MFYALTFSAVAVLFVCARMRAATIRARRAAAAYDRRAAVFFVETSSPKGFTQ